MALKRDLSDRDLDFGLYKVAIEGKGTLHKRESLYHACKDIVNVSGGIVVRNGRERDLVAFWCDWKHRVCSGYGALERERSAVKDYRMVQ